jgi:hypothetical protein
LPEAAAIELQGVSANISWIEVEPFADPYIAGASRHAVGVHTEQYLSAYSPKTELPQGTRRFVIACVDLGGRENRSIAPRHT